MVGYDMSNDDWQKTTISQMRAQILRAAAVLCHEFAHAMMLIYLPNQHEPHMNAESIAEAGCSWENYVFGGTFEERDGHICIIPWPNYALWSVYAGLGQNLALHNFSKVALPAHESYDPFKFRWECFLEQEFWEESKPSDSTIAADETPLANTRDKRVRPSDSEMERERIGARRAVRREALQARNYQWDRCVDKAEDKREEFLDNGGLRVFDEFWAGCTKHCDEHVFL